jgi:hypothetical protein
MNPDMMARGLGMFSIGLGAAELLAPEQLAEALGMEGHEDLIRLYGLREIGTGIGCLTQNPPTPWVWGRVAGDALDIATLLPYLGPDNPKRGNVAIALAAVAGVTLLDVLCGAWWAEGRSGPMTRRVRQPLERVERRNEARARWEQRERDFATAGASRDGE